MRVGNPSYIEIYDNALNKKECDILINQFEKSNQRVGHTSLGYVPQHKKCLELIGPSGVPCFSDNSRISTILQSILIKYVDQYSQQYSHLLANISWWKCNDEYSFQKYDGENDGYKAWHCEHGPGLVCSDRILAWMFYLNNAKSGTEFVQYPTVCAKMGRCVIWPAAWTHVHRGVTPNKGLKYIITGWVSFKNEK